MVCKARPSRLKSPRTEKSGASRGKREFGEFLFRGGLNVGHECPTPEGGREIPRLRDPTRQTTARHKESGRSARDDSGEKGGPPQKDGPYSGGRNANAIRENGDPRVESSFHVRP